MATRYSEEKRALFRAAYDYDTALRHQCGDRLCGIDEAGRGPLAGPVVAAAVILPPDMMDAPFFDSKQLTAKQREEAYRLVTDAAIEWAIGIVDAKEIDRINILQATHAAMRQALASLQLAPDIVLIDGGNLPGIVHRQRKLIHGDATSQSIAAASIVAKVTRDRWMMEADKQYPKYGFAKHAGYGTREHVQALEQFGPTSIHRMSFRPVLEASQRLRKLAIQANEMRPGRQQSGMALEQAALSFLQTKGYQLLEQNWRTSFGELDLIMTAENTLVFVEVRSKKGGLPQDILRAAESVDDRKRRRIHRLAEAFLQSQPKWQKYDCRFDVIAVTWADELDRPLLEHYIAAF